MKKLLRTGLCMLAIPLWGGCAMMPKYNRPEAPVPERWPESPASHAAAPEGASAAELPWRAFFADEKLQTTIGMALENNRDLRLAALNVERAQALYRVQRSELFPTLQASAAGGKHQSSTDLVQPGSPRITERYEVNLGVASWEIDLFGRLRSLKEQALQEYLSAEQTRRAAQIALVSEVARVYLALAADREALRLAQATLESQQGIYTIIRKRVDAKLANELDLRRAQTQVEAARGDLARFTQRVAQDRNALDLLAGAPVPEDQLPADLAAIRPPCALTPGLSSDVLLGRPDILAAEHQLQGANALIGAARAAFFPRIGLTVAMGTASDELSRLFGSGTGIWSFTPSVVLPIFDSRVWAAKRVSESVQKIALAQYEKTIQAAFREVADVLAERSTVGEQVAAQQALVEAAQEIYRLSDKRYTKGIDSYLSVLDAQRSLYGAQQGLITLRLVQLANEVRTYAVLGGGGEAPPPPAR